MDKSNCTNQMDEGDTKGRKSVLDGIGPNEWLRLPHKEQEALAEEYHQELRGSKRPKVVKTEGSTAKHTPPVSKKAKEVLKRVSEGMTKAEIAKELGIGLSTVYKIIKDTKQE